MIVLVKNTHVKRLSQENADASNICTYQIKTIRASESAIVFFARSQDEQQQQFVIKVLRDYEDTRFSLKDCHKRLESQIEALQWNQKFTPDIYLGLGRIVSPDLATIERKLEKGKIHHLLIENVINDVRMLTNEALLEGEYALIMECLPKERRLDYLLRQRKMEDVKEFLQTLVERVFLMHEAAVRPSNFHLGDNGLPWGSYEQLKQKLHHNLGLFDNLARLKDTSFYENYSWLKAELLETIDDQRWKHYFTVRLQSHRIKRCHGDLKARNIWVASKDRESRAEQRVRILDTIDFNPAYCNIDVLSDIAMLAVDVQAVDMQLHEHDGLDGRGYELANVITHTYLRYAGEENDETARVVLAYYMLEKAIVRASISLFYDYNEHPQLGTYFLELAVKYVKVLKDMLNSYSCVRHQMLYVMSES